MIEIACKSQLIEELNLRLEVYKGSVTFSHLTQFKKTESQSPTYFRPWNVLTDIRDLTVTSTTNELNDLYKFMRQDGDIQTQRKSAILTKTPSQHVYANIYSTIASKDNCQIKVFLSTQEALDWLHCDIDTSKIESIFKLLKAQTQLVER